MGHPEEVGFSIAHRSSRVRMIGTSWVGVVPRAVLRKIRSPLTQEGSRRAHLSDSSEEPPRGDQIVVTVARVMGVQGRKPRDGAPLMRVEYADGSTEAMREDLSVEVLRP